MTEQETGTITDAKAGGLAGFFKDLRDNISIGAMFANLTYSLTVLVLAMVAVFSSSSWPERMMNVVSACVGLGLGWVLGIVVSPSDESEQSEFSAYTKALSTFFTGYVAGALKDVKLHNVMDYLYQPHIALRVCLGAACFLATTSVVFLNRRAEVQNRNRRWYIAFEPRSAAPPDSTPLGLLTRGPFCNRDDVDREIKRLQETGNYKSVTLKPIAQL
jgi:hypothetical protein